MNIKFEKLLFGSNYNMVPIAKKPVDKFYVFYYYYNPNSLLIIYIYIYCD